MANPNRAAQLGRIHKVLKKHYEVVTPPERTLLEHLLYGALLENSAFEKADEVFARLTQTYFDWNEMRVTTAAELAESLTGLAEPEASAANFRRILQGVFETHYAFDIETLKKLNLGKAIEQLAKFSPNSAFAAAYATQHGLGGHHIPVDSGALQALVVLGVINEAESAKREVPGMERAIPKNKGPEFASLLHHLAADFHASPYSAKVKAILTEIDPTSKDRMPKRGVKKEEPPVPAKGAAKQHSEKPTGKSVAASGKPASADAAKTPEGKKAAAPTKPGAPQKPTLPLKPAPAEGKKKEAAKEKKGGEGKPARKPEPRTKAAAKNTIGKRKPR